MGGFMLAQNSPAVEGFALPDNGMIEAFDDRDDGPKVTVEETSDESDAKETTLANVKALVECEASMQEVEAAIQAAHGAGANETDLADAQEYIRVLQQRGKIQEKLSKAIAEKDVYRLQKAIAKAEEFKVSGASIQA